MSETVKTPLTGMDAKATVELRIKPPRPPSYVFLEGIHESAKIGVEHLTDDQLRAVGAAFTAELIAHAKNRRGKHND